MLEVPDVDFIRQCGVVVLVLFYCRLDLCCGECYFGCLQFVCFLYMCLFVLCFLCLTVLVNCLLNAFAICVGEVNVFSMKVIVFFWLIRILSSKAYLCCVCDPSVCLGVPSICQICMLYVISEFNSEIEGSLAFCALMLFLCFILCLEVVCMWSVSCLLGCCVCLREECCL